MRLCYIYSKACDHQQITGSENSFFLKGDQRIQNKGHNFHNTKTYVMLSFSSLKPHFLHIEFK